MLRILELARKYDRDVSPTNLQREDERITSNSQSILYVMSNSRNMYW